MIKHQFNNNILYAMFIYIIFIIHFSLYCNAFVYDFSRAPYYKNYLNLFPNLYLYQYYPPSMPSMYPSDDIINKIKSIQLQQREYHEKFTENLKNQIFSEFKNHEMQHRNFNHFNQPFNFGYPHKNEYSYPPRFEKFSLNRYTRDNSRKDSSKYNQHFKHPNNNMGQGFNYQNNLETHYNYKRFGDKQFERITREDSRTQSREWFNSERNINSNENQDQKKPYRSKREHRKIITNGNYYSDSNTNNNDYNQIKSHPIRSQMHYREYRIHRSWDHSINDPMPFVIESYLF